MKTIDMSAFIKKLGKNKYVLLVLLLGLILILLPTTSKSASASSENEAGDAMEASGIPLAQESDRIAALLSQIEEVGRVDVLLSKEGAVIVCDGADNARVRLNVTTAVMSYTGLGSDKISVMKMK